MTLAEIIALARLLLSETNANLSYSTDDDLTAFINDGIAEMCTKASVYEKRDTLTVVSGTATYTLPSDFLEMVYLLDNYGRLLTLVEPSLIGALYRIDGVPTWYTIFGVSSGDRNLTLIDTPGVGAAGEYTYGYYAMAPSLVSSSDVPAFPADKHRYLAIYACYRHGEKSKDQSLAMQFYVEFAAGLGLQLSLPKGEGNG